LLNESLRNRRCFVDIFWPFEPPTEHPHKLPNLIVKELPNFHPTETVNCKPPHLASSRSTSQLRRPQLPVQNRSPQARRVFYTPFSSGQALFLNPSEASNSLPGARLLTALLAAFPRNERRIIRTLRSSATLLSQFFCTPQALCCRDPRQSDSRPLSTDHIDYCQILSPKAGLVLARDRIETEHHLQPRIRQAAPGSSLHKQ